MNKQDIRQIRAGIRQMVKQRTEKLEQIPKDQWPDDSSDTKECERLAVWISSGFLVQLLRDRTHNVSRITVNRVAIDNQGRWRDGITWDELQHIKNEIGFSTDWLVEIFPPSDRVVNVANMRHLWIVPKPQFAWQ